MLVEEEFKIIVSRYITSSAAQVWALASSNRGLRLCLYTIRRGRTYGGLIAAENIYSDVYMAIIYSSGTLLVKVKVMLITWIKTFAGENVWLQRSVSLVSASLTVDYLKLTDDLYRCYPILSEENQ